MQPESITAKVARFTGTGVNGSAIWIQEHIAVSAVNMAHTVSLTVPDVLRLLRAEDTEALPSGFVFKVFVLVFICNYPFSDYCMMKLKRHILAMCTDLSFLHRFSKKGYLFSGVLWAKSLLLRFSGRKDMFLAFKLHNSQDIGSASIFFGRNSLRKIFE